MNCYQNWKNDIHPDEIIFYRSVLFFFFVFSVFKRATAAFTRSAHASDESGDGDYSPNRAVKTSVSSRENSRSRVRMLPEDISTQNDNVNIPHTGVRYVYTDVYSVITQIGEPLWSCKS